MEKNIERLMILSGSIFCDLDERYFEHMKRNQVWSFTDEVGKILLSYSDEFERLKFLEIFKFEIQSHLLNCDLDEVNEFKLRQEYVDIQIKRLKVIIDENPKDAQIDITELIHLQDRTKIILLNELGILKLLKKNDVFMKNTQLSKMIAALICGKGQDVRKVYNSIRTDLSYLDSRKKGKLVYTDPQKKKVNSILATFSLPPIK